MNSYQRLELIEEIEGLVDEQGITDLPMMQNLADKTDLMLLTLRDGLVERGEGAADRQPVGAYLVEC